MCLVQGSGAGDIGLTQMSSPLVKKQMLQGDVPCTRKAGWWVWYLHEKWLPMVLESLEGRLSLGLGFYSLALLLVLSFRDEM